jgi:hypothetical protein
LGKRGMGVARFPYTSADFGKGSNEKCAGFGPAFTAPQPACRDAGLLTRVRMRQADHSTER